MEGEMKSSTDFFIKEFAIPFYQSKVINWEKKKQLLFKIYNNNANLTIQKLEEQYTDYDIREKNEYTPFIESILYDDIKKFFDTLNITQTKIKHSWFQAYNKAHCHGVHNHGFGGFSMVCYIKYNPLNHLPTTFIAPFVSMIDGNVLEYEPEGVDEGTIIFFPSALSHYAPTNISEDQRIILSANF